MPRWLPRAFRTARDEWTVDDSWRAIEGAAQAAHRRAPARYRREIGRIDDAPNDWRPGLIVAGTLRLKLQDVMQSQKVTVDELASAHSAAFTALTGRDQQWLARTMELLLDDPNELQLYRPDIDEYMSTHGEAMDQDMLSTQQAHRKNDR